EHLTLRDVLEDNVSDLDHISSIEDSSGHLPRVDPEPIGTALVDDLEMFRVDTTNLRMNAAHGGVVQRNVAFLAASDEVPVHLEGVFVALVRADQHDESIGEARR